MRFFIKSASVAGSSYFGFYSLKNLPITIVSTIKAASPLLVVLFSIIYYGEVLNIAQYIGIVLTIIAMLLLGHNSKKESINLIHSKGFWYLICSVVFGYFWYNVVS